jgi:hypothetical protein
MFQSKSESFQYTESIGLLTFSKIVSETVGDSNTQQSLLSSPWPPWAAQHREDHFYVMSCVAVTSVFALKSSLIETRLMIYTYGREPLQSGKLSTVDLLVLTSLDQLF